MEIGISGAIEVEQRRREARARRTAERHAYKLVKLRRELVGGPWLIVSPITDTVVWHSDGLTLDEVEEFLTSPVGPKT